MELAEPVRILLIIGANIIGVYALFKILQVSYWFLKDKRNEEEF